jgi:hypothetical protein
MKKHPNDCRGVDVATLSTCETGLGKTASGEGVPVFAPNPMLLTNHGSANPRIC